MAYCTTKEELIEILVLNGFDEKTAELTAKEYSLDEINKFSPEILKDEIYVHRRNLQNPRPPQLSNKIKEFDQK